ncbi:class C sortase [Bifidobacterium sp. ESL0682]|uniref:class C sortase n=1 Tax=Bifidobacterium sp. ESL0682 TaxID=2983212 RepID=UPI0023F8B312|nr:class C sortase [Bifidobacterium sp. ESL0682]WEV41881.1 class C sortase [Bifidobacterium sp. ESL0682]
MTKALCAGSGASADDVVKPRKALAFPDKDDIQAAQERAKKARRTQLILKALAVLMLLSGFGVVAYPFTAQFITGMSQRRQSDFSAAQVAGWPYPHAKEALEAADQYNHRLALSGQPVMGESVDPFSSGKSAGQSAEERDRAYQFLLDQGGGVMGSIVIPKISVNIPIFHGTSEKALAAGAGHLYGTSLPVGGTSTHSVITGHRGMVQALMFTRLDEMRKGDTFYVRTMGKTIGYKVDRINVIDPQDTSRLKIERGADRITLMTCTPYGINTHRLLVSGVRSEIPNVIPAPEDARPDFVLLMALVLLLTLVTLVVLAFIRSRKTAFPIRHARDEKR